MTTIADFEAKTIDGAAQKLGDYQGKVLLVVNVASQCGLTPQYGPLEEIHEQFEGRGFAVLGFPCNQFGSQEPGTEGEIKKFCESKFGVTFPMFGKVDVNGETAHPLYQWLTQEPTQPEGPGAIVWNFGKFLIGRDGKVLARFSPKVSPTDPRVTEAIEGALGSK
jgi:glutathione peroxidase